MYVKFGRIILLVDYANQLPTGSSTEQTTQGGEGDDGNSR